jgi:stage III sporulation protein SpoIIIAA
LRKLSIDWGACLPPDENAASFTDQWARLRELAVRVTKPRGQRLRRGKAPERIVTTRTHTDGMHLLLATLPERLQDALSGMSRQDLLEVILDLGRVPQARFADRVANLSNEPVRQEDLERVIASLGEFGGDNRSGIEGTLHRVSALRNRRGRIVGLTLRVGRAVLGTIDLIRDLVERGDNLLLLGRPGIGKTTKLREIARVLADDLGKRVIVVDTSNEIAGDGDVPHAAIGSARRMQVPHPEHQHAMMIEAVENHMPEVIIVDEIGTAAEAFAARTIAERGVQLIGTAHGNTLRNVVMNPTLCDLVGGVQTVILGDEEARLRGTQKTITERGAQPTFNAVVEIVSREELVLHPDAARAVDELLRGRDPGGVHRSRDHPREMALPESVPVPSPDLREQPPRRPAIFCYAISRDLVERVIRGFRLEATTVRRPEQGDLILALRSRAEDPRLQAIVQQTAAPLQLVRKNTSAQIRRVLQNVLNVSHVAGEERAREAVREAEAAVRKVMAEGVRVELAPRSLSLRRLQHRVAVRSRLSAQSIGSEPERRLVIRPRIGTSDPDFLRPRSGLERR